MSQKLFPPIIESKLPAQKGDILTIPFLHNRSVGENQYNRMVLKIKTISTNQEIGILESDGKSQNFIIDDSIKNNLQIGQYYKAQIAYVDTAEVVGYYSSVGVFKYTDSPQLTIWSDNETQLSLTSKNTVGTTLYGHYQNTDAAEKVYSYIFNIYKDDVLLHTSGELLHKSENDSTNESIDSFTFNYIMDDLSVYKVEYGVITNNNLEAFSPIYYIGNPTEIPNNYNYIVEAKLNQEIGGVQVKMLMQDQSDIQGHFRLVRFFDDKQEVVKEFTINSIAITQFDLGTDLTVEHGRTYTYGIQQFNNSFITEYVKSNPVYIDFEDIFLYDGKRQLKIKFNPKVASFKNTILESKLDTIGGQHPFIFRNGRVKYKEFSIAGLISYHMDNENLFTQRENEFSINLTGDNIAAERDFKLLVLEWLNNGKPKLFRSPTEGNYIVRLMNISLSPEDTLGRMLHSFNSTAYEITECNYENLISYNLVPNYNDYNNLWRFYSLNDLNIGSYVINDGVWARIYGECGSKYIIRFNNKSTSVIQIGATGMYEIFCQNEKIIEIELCEKNTTILELPHKIEYATIKAETDKIIYNNQVVSSIRSYEYCSMFQNNNNENIITAITQNNQLILDNILFLRFQYTGAENSSGTITYRYHNDNNINQIQLNNVKVDEKENVWYQTVAGRLELSVADFGGKFILDELIVDDNIRVDIYYRVKVINEEDKV